MTSSGSGKRRIQAKRHVAAHFRNHAAFARLADSNSFYKPSIAPFAESGSEDSPAQLFRKQVVMGESLIPTVQVFDA